VRRCQKRVTLQSRGVGVERNASLCWAHYTARRNCRTGGYHCPLNGHTLHGRLARLLTSAASLVPIPEFTADGILPPGRYACTETEVEARLVDGYPSSQTRSTLFKGWVHQRSVLRAIVPIMTQWIDGGFVEDKDDPSDIDLCTFLDGPTVEQLTPPAQEALARVVAHEAKGLFGCDAYVVLVYPHGHEAYEAYLKSRGYWDNWWGRTRDGQVKGYLEVS
jgi:hypothetical protein